MGVTHLTLNLSLRCKGCHRIDGHDIDGAAADEHLGDLKRLLAIIRLGYQQVVDIDADPAGIVRVHGVLGIDESTNAATLLRLGDDMVDHGRLAGRLGAEYLDDAPARHAAYPQGDVQRQCTGGNDAHLHPRTVIPHPHDRPFAELPFDLAHCSFQRFVFLHFCLHSVQLDRFQSLV